MKMTSRVTMCLGNVTVHQGSPAAAVRRGKRIEKIGKLKESREMREYQLCHSKTNPKSGPTQVVKRECLV